MHFSFDSVFSVPHLSEGKKLNVSIAGSASLGGGGCKGEGEKGEEATEKEGRVRGKEGGLSHRDQQKQPDPQPVHSVAP